MSNKAQMFISYARSDQETVKNIYARLKKMPLIKPWRDKEDLLGGENWELAVRRVISESQFVLLCLSTKAIKHRGVLQQEIKFALTVLEKKLEDDVFLIPTWIQAGPIPSDDMPDSLQKYNWLNLSDPDDWNKLARTVEVQLRRLGFVSAVAGFEAAGAAGAAPATTFQAQEFIAELKQALDASDAAAVSRKCEALLAHLRRADHPLPGRDAARILRHLSRHHLLEHSGAVADALLLAGSDAAAVRRVYAWALLERGLLHAPLSILENLNAETTDNPTERAEVGKLRGHIYTRTYLDAGDPSGARVQRALRDAVSAYTQVYDADPKRHLLHGARAAALLLRAERDGHELGADHAPRELAEAVMGELRDREEFEEAVSMSDAAAAVDACLALGQHAEALAWLTRLADDEGAGVSDLIEARRQLEDVWQLKPDAEPGSSMLPLLGQRLAVLQAARPAPPLAAAAGAASEPPPVLEKVFSPRRPDTLDWYKRGLERANSVACIRDADGRTVGTGFLVSARDFRPDLGEELLFLTACYLLTDEKLREKLPFVVLNPKDAAIAFTTSGQSYKVGQILWTSPTDEFDATLLRLEPPVEGIAPLPVARELPPPAGGAGVFAIGHPGGRDLEISLADSFLIDHDGVRLHYTTPTEPGSGGSPIFDENWSLIALHHKRSPQMPRLHGKPGAYGAGEGIAIHAIIRALRPDADAPAGLE